MKKIIYVLLGVSLLGCSSDNTTHLSAFNTNNFKPVNFKSSGHDFKVSLILSNKDQYLIYLAQKNELPAVFINESKELYGTNYIYHASEKGFLLKVDASDKHLILMDAGKTETLEIQ